MFLELLAAKRERLLYCSLLLFRNCSDFHSQESTIRVFIIFNFQKCFRKYITQGHLQEQKSSEVLETNAALERDIFFYMLKQTQNFKTFICDFVAMLNFAGHIFTVLLNQDQS